MKFLNTTITNKTNSFFAFKKFSNAFTEADLGLLQAVNYYHKELHLGCCSRPRSASAFISVKIFWMFVLSLRLMMDENAIDVDGETLEILLKIF